MEGLNSIPIQEQAQATVEKKLTKDQLLELRFNQSEASKLAEYITGMRPDDPQMLERLITDQKILRAKYNLPTIESRTEYPFAEYERLLYEMAAKNNVTIRDKDEHVRFFENYMASALYDDDLHAVFVGMERDTEKKYGKSLVTLEHELIHGEQEVHAKTMPIELQEYEAYVASMNMPKFKNMPEEIESVLFSFSIGVSTNIWYAQNKENGKGPIEPVWRDPVYFLKHVDNMNDEDIEAYKILIQEREESVR